VIKRVQTAISSNLCFSYVQFSQIFLFHFYLIFILNYFILISLHESSVNEMIN